ncbi:hypothetical protein [Paracoccus sediminilitoris]|uniref:hypothetical protein n=1 Tax=Paracoccus sediminilitoris TaxID=2202419 RepID=UPI00272C4C44|nr:hypothetical protein [Paracoccus sediminilitoris]
MAMNLTRPVGTVVSDNAPVGKGPMRDLLNDLVSAIEGKAEIQDSGKLFFDRASAVSAGQGKLVPAIGRIFTVEGDDLVLRGQGQTGDDPLFATQPRWGVVDRYPARSLLDALAADLATRRIASTANSSFAGTTFPTGTTTVLFRNGGNAALWARVEGAPPAPVPASFQQDQAGQWWERVWQASDIREALGNAGVFSLRGIGGTANGITATLSDAAIAAGISVGSDTTVEIVPTLANTGTVTLKVGADNARTIKTETGAAAPAGYLRPGVPVQLRRVNADWRALPSVTSDQLTALGNDMASADALEASARANADGYIRAAILAASISLGTVTLAGNSYSAAIASASADIGGSDIVGGSSFWFIPPVTNPAANPDLTVGANKRGIRRADGSTWPAGGFVASRPYLLMRSGNTYLVLYGEVTRVELDAALAAPLRTKVTITDTSPASERNTQNMVLVPAAYRGIALSAMANPPLALSAPYSFELMTDATAAGLRQVWHNHDGRQFTARRIDGVWTPWTEQARESRVAALEGKVDTKAAQADMAAAGLLIGQHATEIAGLRMTSPEFLAQTGPELPIRPSLEARPFAIFKTWDDCTHLMGPDDLWMRVDAPEEPDAPDPASWQVYNARNGQGVVFVIEDVEAQTPPVTAIDRLIGSTGGDDEGNAPWEALPAALPGRYMVNGLAPGPHPVNIRHRNFVGAGLESLARSVTVDARDIAVNLTGPGNLPALRPVDWFNIMALPTNRGFVCDAAGLARPSHTNQTYRLAYRDYFVTAQVARLAAIEALDDKPHVNGIDGVGLGLNFQPRTGEVVFAVFQPTGVRLFYRPAVGGLQLLAALAQTWSYPFAPEVSRLADTLRIRVDGTTVLEHVLAAGSPQAALTDGFPELYCYVSGNGNAQNTRFRGLQLGHA